MWPPPQFGKPPVELIAHLAAELQAVEQQLDALQLQVRNAGNIQWRSKGADAYRQELAVQEQKVRAAGDEVQLAASDMGQYAAWLDSSASVPGMAGGGWW